nr:uncharacterized protein LOC105327379 isoform X4 [Crassostrea gigas]
MIPILLEPIEMPRELQTINYVDGTLEGTDVANKIYNACLFGTTENCILPNIIPFQEDTELRKQVNDETRSRQIDDLCNEIVEELNTSRYRTRYILYSASFWGRLWCFLVLGAPALTVLPLLIVLIKEGEITEQTLAGVCSTLVVVPIVAVSIFLCCCFGKNMIKGRKLLEKITWKHLSNNYKTLMVIPLVRSTEEIVFINYDTDPCKKFCVCVLKRKIEDEEEIQKKADSMILEFIFKHRFDLAHWHGLEDFKYNRHNTYFQKKCICQYLEPSLVSDSLL